jgi:DnaK suppressor protein
MTEQDQQRFRGILEAKAEELTGAARNRDDIAIENAPDALDQVQLMGERELAIRNLDRDSAMLRQVRRAIGRLDDESYGICARCEEDIAPKRLNAVPWAAYCIKCQEHLDRHQAEREEIETYEEVLA